MFKQVVFSRKNDLVHFFWNQSQISGGKPIFQDRETDVNKQMDREKSGFDPVTFCIPMAFTAHSLSPSGLEIAQCRLQSQFVVDNCRAWTECRTDVSG